MKKIYFFAFFFLLAAALFGSDNICIYVFCSGKHSGIIMPEKYADISYLANKDKYSEEKYIEYGFGDKKYYLAKPPPSLYLAARAVLWPTASVIRVSKPDSLISKKIVNDSAVYPIEFTKKQVLLLNSFIKKSFKLNKNNKAEPIGHSTYENSDFYDGSRDFYLFYTCNMWVAKALKYADYNINTWFIFTRGNLESQLKNKLQK